MLDNKAKNIIDVNEIKGVMVEVMLDVARTSLKMLGKDLFNQLTKK